MRKLLGFLILAGLIFVLACAGNGDSSVRGSSDGDQNGEGKVMASSNSADGEKIFKQYCILCHGADGKLGLNGAKDITVTELSVNEIAELVRTGRNTMTPFEGILSPEEMKAVAVYTQEL